ncbi:hypothetical protein [Sphingobium naphthae]|uniref:Uncharacterized protein n=1 Tax=Sphingobium naphthae TaxID=1886786 RepID=A0ABU3ZUI0_9SPHN|nr:hypothetical protein [Sphingobium naphthae]MDV5823156.1 hypothetical protein [Sphingobium naphthae]
MRALLNAILLLSGIVSVAAHARQDAGPTDVGDSIVVEGRKMTPKEVREGATGFVRTLGVVQGDQSVARWQSPICPAVLGVPEDVAQIAESKVRAIIEDVKAPLAKPGCDANLLIAFVEDGRDLMKLVAYRRPKLLYQMQGPDRRNLVDGDAPIRWWHVTGSGTGGGSPSGGAPSPATGGNTEGGGSILPDGVAGSSSYSSSLIRPPVTRSFSVATVIIDVHRAEGITLSEAAAYATFVGLAEVRDSADPPVASILNLFKDGQHPGGLTFWDRQFLTELYELPLNRFGRVQRGHLIKGLVEGGHAPVKEEAP